MVTSALLGTTVLAAQLGAAANGSGIDVFIIEGSVSHITTTHPIEVIRRHRTEPVEAVVEAIVDAVREFGDGAPLEDDMTVVVVRRLVDSDGAKIQESLVPVVDGRPGS